MRNLFIILILLIAGAGLFAGGSSESEGPGRPTEEVPGSPQPGSPSPATGGAPDTGSATGPVAGERSIDSETRQLLEESRIRVFRERVDSIPFTLKNPQGEDVSLADYQGSALLLNFWATWCPPCIEELPSMIRLEEELRDSNFAMLAVSLREEPELVSSFLEEHGFDLPVALDISGQVGMEYGVRGIPTSYVIDQQGKVLGVLVGAREWDDPEVIALFEHLGGE